MIDMHYFYDPYICSLSIYSSSISTFDNVYLPITNGEIGPTPYMLLLGLSTVTCLLGGLDTSGVGLGSTGFTSQRLHQSTGGLEWSCEITFGLLAPDVELGGVGLEDGLDGHQRLDE
jgi:hypothetical protein